MAQITINIPAAQVQRVVDAMCSAGGFAPPPIDPPPTDTELRQLKNEFARQMIIDYVKKTVRREEREAAERAAAEGVTSPDVS